LAEYVLSIFDKLENLPHVVRIGSDSDDLEEIIVSAYAQLVDIGEPMTLAYIEANAELFNDYVVVSIFANPGPNLLPDVGGTDLLEIDDNTD
jgi:hypothetical protein